MKWKRHNKQKNVLNHRLESIGRALFLIMIGSFWLWNPENRVPESFWLIGIGVIMLGLNAVSWKPCKGFYDSPIRIRAHSSGFLIPVLIT